MGAIALRVLQQKHKTLKGYLHVQIYNVEKLCILSKVMKLIINVNKEHKQLPNIPLYFGCFSHTIYFRQCNKDLRL